MNLNKAISVAVAGAGVWYAMTGNTNALKVFVGVTGAMALPRATPFGEKSRVRPLVFSAHLLIRSHALARTPSPFG